MNFAQIILPLNLKGAFTYRIPADFKDKIEVGMRVLVSFRGKKIYTGIVFQLHDEVPEGFLPKEIISLLDESAILPQSQLFFWQWLSEYYLCNLGEIYRFSFPASLKLESETYLKLKPNVSVAFENLDVHEMHLIHALEVRQLINVTEIEAFIPKKEIVKTIKSLIDLQYIEIDEKIAETYKAKEVAYLRLKNPAELRAALPEILLTLKRSPRQQELLLSILEHETEFPGIPLKKSQFLDHGNFGTAPLKTLISKNWVEEYYLQKDRIELYDGETENLQRLTPEQQTATKEIETAFAQNQNVLLHGVTSSGKTHVYLEIIEQTVAAGRNVLFLLPEISLTKQIVQRLEKKYGRQLGFYHQKLSDFERVEVWRKVRNGEIKVLIGTRNALFLPYSDLGLIVVDEEHDSAYKPREVSPFFNARDAAMMLANFYGGRVIMGSATPSVESYYLALKNKIAHVKLKHRFGNVSLPVIEIINFKEAQDSKKSVGNFSLGVIDEIKTQIDRHKQIMILHNRRGYSNVIECESCGYVNYCSNCDVVMTFHKFSNEMKCHYCGQKAAKPKACPRCNSTNLNLRGVGVEQIHEEISRLLPDAEVDRMDVDSMRKKFAYEKLYEKIEEGETDVLVGTQMISKGLDFENIELVAIPKADSLLYVQDFRAEERAYQLITQVSGRAGRVSGEGKVMIQTYNPVHPVFKLIAEHDSSEVYTHLLAERQKFHYPPYVKLIMIELKHRRDDKADRCSQFLGSVLRKYLPEECILGPEKSPIAKLNLLYQYQIWLKIPRKNYAEFKSLVMKSLDEVEEISAYKSVKKLIFVDF